MLNLKRLAILFTLIAVLIGGTFLWSRPTSLRIAVGPADTEQARFITRMTAALSASGEPFRFTIVPVAGTQDASTALDEGRADLAVARSDDLTSRLGRAIAILQRRNAFIIARADRIKGLADLRGRSILLVQGQGDPNLQLASRILAHFDLVETARALRELPLAEATDTFARGDADAMFFIAPVAGRNIRELVQHMVRAGDALQIIELSGARGLVSRFPYLEVSVIPPGVFGGVPPLPGEEVDSVSINYELIASQWMSDMTAAALTKSLLGMRLRNSSAAGSQFAIEAPPTDQPRRFMPHPGTTAFLDNETKTLLETYSDHLWLGLFAVSILGSSVTGFLVWAGVRKPAESRDAFEHLPALVERIPSAVSLVEVDAIQMDFDHIASMSVLDYARGRLGEDDLDRAAWLAQVQRLIDRRRQVLAAQVS